MKKTFSGKLVFIVGASEGIGFSVAQELLKNGSRVIIASRSLEKLRKAKEALGDVETLSFDVSNFEAVKKGIDQTVEKFGVPDLVINCAGYATPGYLQDLPVGEIQGMIETNYLGSVYLCKATLPHFRKKRGGHIVLTSSIAGFLGLFGYTAYSASKFAVIGFAEGLRRELKPFGIKVSVLCPPTTKTPGLERENRTKPEEVWKMEQNVKAVTPDLVARKLLEGIQRNQFLIHPTWDGKLSYYLNRYLPWVLDRFLRRPAGEGS